ncbi:MAG: 50S ribosomal protein L17 [Chloroflexota bacterium]|nr:50S ribosomal protein L17 [Chloroflexota bacterium]
MRHKVAGKKLNRTSAQRGSLRRTMLKQFFEHERIRTTRAKAEFIRRPAEKLITLAKNAHDADPARQVHARRLAAARLDNNRDIVKKIFDDIAPRYLDRPGGYTRMFKLGPRRSDAADMVILELVEE